MKSYPKVLQYGHRFVKDIFEGDNHVEEKYDASQIRFGVFKGELRINSKSANIYIEAPHDLFKKGVEYIVSIQDRLIPEYTYCGECFKNKRHNTLEYSRIPKNYIMIFDIFDNYGNPFTYNIKTGMAYDLGFECAAFLKKDIRNLEEAMSLLGTMSTLGGTTIEGIVIKNYSKLQPSGEFYLCKIVSEAFKEKHIKDWKSNNPSSKDLITTLVEELRTDARYYKAVQHLREQGTLEESPRDIGNLFKEVSKDIEEEEKEYILERLWKYYGKEIKSRVCAGIPEWYKNKLLENLKEDNHEIN